VRSKRDVLEAYERRYQEARTRGVPMIVPAFAKVISRAQEQSTPVSPKKGPWTLIVMAGTFISGLGLSILNALVLGQPDAAGTPRTGSGSGGSGRGRETGRSMQPVAAAKPLAANGHRNRPGIPAAAATRRDLVPATADAAPHRNGAALGGLAQQLIERAGAEPGHRSLLTGEDDAVDTAEAALELARQLAKAGKSVVLVDFAVSPRSAAALVQVPRSPGMRELLAGEAGFEAVVHRLGEGGPHIVAAGRVRFETDRQHEVESLAQVFEALDGAYDHVLVTAETSLARCLFGLLDGGFDLGVIVGRGPAPAGEPGTFLGFTVADFEVLHLGPGLSIAANGAAPFAAAQPAAH
jgi:hypothetical protein